MAYLFEKSFSLKISHFCQQNPIKNCIEVNINIFWRKLNVT
jgi:hypothetical protein